MAGNRDRLATDRRALGKKLEAIGWGLFFIWIGITLIAGLGWGIGLLGIGIIILSMQVVRYNLGFSWEGFSIAVGLLFALGGIWDLLGIHFSLVPIIAIIAGVLFIVSALYPSPKD
jgi:hypothetical protein